MYEIIAIRLEPSADGSHDHIQTVGYESSHMPGEAIMIPPARVLQRQALGEKFWVVVDGEKADVQRADCPACGELQLKTSADSGGTNHLLALPRE